MHKAVEDQISSCIQVLEAAARYVEELRRDLQNRGINDTEMYGHRPEDIARGIYHCIHFLGVALQDEKIHERNNRF